ncbi:MAG: ribosome maturation factor RimM [Polyangiaceae bacterium]
MADRWVPLAEVLRPHGVRGELRLKPYNAESDLLLALDEVLLRLPEGEEHEVSVDGARRANDAVLMKLYSVDDRDRADELRGAVICGRRDDFPPLAPGEFYACDVEGALVVVDDGSSPRVELGRVRALRSYPASDVLEVAPLDGSGAVEVPLVDAVVAKVDVEARLITLRTLEGVEKA